MSPSTTVLLFPSVAGFLISIYLFFLEPNLISEEILLILIPSLFFFIIVSNLIGSQNTTSSFSPSDVAISRKLTVFLNNDWYSRVKPLSNLPDSLESNSFEILNFLTTYIKLLFPSDLDIWRNRTNWFFTLYTRWSELYGFFLNCNFNLFPYFTVPPDYRRIITWRGRRLI